jgi:phosphate uptake regulator
MTITSTGIYGTASTIVTSDLYEDVEQLKTNLTTLTTSHLSVATNHDGRLDTLESDNASNITRIGDLEIDVSSNTTRIGDLEIDVSSNITRIDALELDNTSNI